MAWQCPPVSVNDQRRIHTPSVVFRHLSSNPAGNGYATEGVLDLYLREAVSSDGQRPPKGLHTNKTGEHAHKHDARPPPLKKREREREREKKSSVSSQTILILHVLA